MRLDPDSHHVCCTPLVDHRIRPDFSRTLLARNDMVERALRTVQRPLSSKRYPWQRLKSAASRPSTEYALSSPLSSSNVHPLAHRMAGRVDKSVLWPAFEVITCSSEKMVSGLHLADRVKHTRGRIRESQTRHRRHGSVRSAMAAGENRSPKPPGPRRHLRLLVVRKGESKPRGDTISRATPTSGRRFDCRRAG
jgi:hypothetical protein